MLFFCCLPVFSKGQAITNSAIHLQDSTNRVVDKKSFFKNNIIHFSLDILSFYRTLNFHDEVHSLNFNNEIAKLDNKDFGVYLRPALNLEWKKISLELLPRLNSEYNQIENRYEFDAFYFQKAKLEIQLSKKFKGRIGRYFKTIGTSSITNPSNLFFVETNPLNSKFELRPKDFLELGFNATKNINLNLIANIAKGNDKYYDVPYFNFNRQYAIQLDAYGNSFQAGTILSVDEAKRWASGFYAQKNVGDSWVFWVDAAFKYNPKRFYPRVPLAKKMADLINYEMVNDNLNKRVFFQGLFGMSYTFSFGLTLNLEYYHNGMGYRNGLLDDYKKMVYYSADYNFGVTKELSKRNMGRAINAGMQFIRNNYVFSQLGQNDIFGLNFFLRYFNCLDDNSQQISGLIEWNAFDRLELFTVVLFNTGSDNLRDFNRLIKNQIMLGLIFKL